MGVSVSEAVGGAVRLHLQVLVVLPVGFLLPQRQRRLAAVPVPQHLVHVVLCPYAHELVLVTPLVVFVLLVLGLVRAVVEAPHLPADALKVLVDAHLGEALGVVLARLVEHLSLDVDVVGPVFGLKERSLGEARADGPDHEGHEGHDEQEQPTTCLQQTFSKQTQCTVSVGQAHNKLSGSKGTGENWS